MNAATQTPPAEQLAMLRAIAYQIAVERRCHTGDIVSDEHERGVLDSLDSARPRLIDTDLCGHCDEQTCHTLTDAGWAAIGVVHCEECGMAGHCRHRRAAARAVQP